MSYVKHPAPWIGAVLFLLTALSDAERDYSIPFAVVVGWLFGAFCLWLYRYIVASRKERGCSHGSAQTPGGWSAGKAKDHKR